MIGDFIKVKEKLGWVVKYILLELIFEMVVCDVERVRKNYYLKIGGFVILNNVEDVI